MTRRTPKRGDLVVVTWHDAVQHAGGESEPRHAPYVMKTAGYLLKKTRAGVSLAGEHTTQTLNAKTGELSRYAADSTVTNSADPELLEALKQILGWRELRSGNEIPIECIEEIARAAIAKATGEKS